MKEKNKAILLISIAYCIRVLYKSQFFKITSKRYVLEKTSF